MISAFAKPLRQIMYLISIKLSYIERIPKICCRTRQFVGPLKLRNSKLRIELNLDVAAEGLKLYANITLMAVKIN
jgi:hypothetical protein